MKNRTEEKENKRARPYMSEPVISRSGKIGRKSMEDPTDPAAKTVGKERGKEDPGNKGLSLIDERKNRDVTISDGAFLTGREKKAKKNRGVHTVKNREKNPFPVVTVLACVICTVLFMSLIFNLVRINEYTKDVSSMQSEVTALQKQKNELSARLDEKNSVEELKAFMSQFADQMGMVEEGKMNPPEAVTPAKEEKIEDFNTTEESEAIFTTILNALAKNFEDVLSLFRGD